MLAEAITILLLLGIASVCFIRQKKYFYLQAMLPLAFMPLATLLLHAFLLPQPLFAHNTIVYGFYGIAALLTILWVIVICCKLQKPLSRIVYTALVLGFCGLLFWLFLQANLALL